MSAGRAKGWLETEPHVSVTIAVSPDPWHVHGMAGAWWVRQLACTPGHLAGSSLSLPLLFSSWIAGVVAARLLHQI